MLWKNCIFHLRYNYSRWVTNPYYLKDYLKKYIFFNLVAVTPLIATMTHYRIRLDKIYILISAANISGVLI